MQLTIASKYLNSNNLEKPFKLFLLGARENRKIGDHILLLLCCYPSLLLPTLIALLLLLL